MLEKRVRVDGDLFVKIFPACPCPEVNSSGLPPPPPPQRMSAEFMQTIKNPSGDINVEVRFFNGLTLLTHTLNIIL